MSFLDKYDYFLFDLDGTITDPGIGITNSVMYALDKFGIRVEDRTELYKFIGPPLRVSFSKFYGFSEEQSEQATAFYRETYRVKGIFECELYEGVVETLKQLKNRGKKVLLATSKPEEFAIRILEHFGLSDYFDVAAGSTMDGSRDKKADVIAYAFEKASIHDKAKALMIGDREQDILGAQENEIDSCGVLYGYGDREEHEKAGATYIIEHISDLLK